MICLKNITKSYENGFNALNNVSINIDAGEFVAITGKSGSGKSTLLNIIGMLDDYNQGQYIFNNILINDMSDKHKSNLRSCTFGYIFQEYYLDLELNVWQNLELPFLIKKTKKSEYREIIKNAIKRFGLEGKEKIKAKKLSGGEKQRVCIARAMIDNPSVLLADEPTGALDSFNSSIVLKYLLEFNKEGKTIILVTHNKDEASLASRIVTMKDGAIISDEKNETKLVFA